ncbi:DinB family protein [Longimicrobium sp.]|uniref:DinB family protein n=1 Tax=Longimicrobium sp. TaxID=2029185 RepID=UPI002E3210A9|nr:DinB family protein [Longimicrobium sp.]HEX6042233.1 DinB family protein [Longimicrobium sp.]
MHPRMQELLSFIDEQYAALRAAADAVPEADRERQPEPGRWSVAQVVEHVSRVEGLVGHLIGQKIAEARASGVGPETETSSIIREEDLAKLTDRSYTRQAPERAHPSPDVRYGDAWALLDAAHAAAREALASGEGLALETVELPHPALGTLNVYQWGVAIGGHEARHAAQIRECAATVADAA